MIGYLRRPILTFLPSLCLLTTVLLVGSYCFHHYYAQDQLTYVRSLYITYCLVFMEHLIPFPDHWVLQLFYFVLPPLGLVVILDGLMRFGYRVLRRHEGDPEWVRAMAKTYSNHVILCGLGRVGSRILDQLLQLEEDVLVLESSADSPHVATARRKHVTVMIGNGREDQTLIDLNVETAKSIILATNDDLANLEMALDSRRLNPNIQVVMRMFDQEMASKIKAGFAIHLAFSTSTLAAPLFATASSDPSIENAFYVEDRLLVVARLTIHPKSKMADYSLDQLADEQSLAVVSWQRGGERMFFPPGDTLLQTGDRVTVQTEPKVLKSLHHWNGDPASG